VNYLSAESLSKSYHDKWLFQDLTLGIAQGDKIALVGENGVGKSTLLKILIGQVQPDGGKVSIRDGIKLGDLVQQPQAPGHLTVNDILFDDKNKIAAVVKEYEHLIHDPHVSSEKMQLVLDQMEEYQAWEYDAKVQEITSKLGINNLDQKFEELSGGQRKRTFLAQMLLASPDLLVLDEPTNHLDLEAIEWLENYLSGQNITLLMVTHDRYFLDNVANLILEIDRGKLYSYRGKYAYFLEKKSEREEMLKTEVAKAKSLMKKELEWMRKQPRARGTKAKYRVEAFYEIQEKASTNLKKDRLELDLQERRQGGKILELHAISKSFGSQKMIENFSYIFKKKDRIGVVGKNGVGKSTFLNLLTGKTRPDSGETIPGVTTKIGYFTQETQNLDPTHRVIEEVKEIAEFITLADGSQVSASRFLELFLFTPEKQYTFIEKLSGGEKKRLQLLKVLVTNPNFLILDEPTNDFDIETLNVLEDFLEKFSGCLVLVSHDRYFMDHLVDELFVFEGDGTIRLFNGNYSDYRIWLDEKEQVPEPLEEIKIQPSQKLKNDKPKISFKEKQEYEHLTTEIEGLERKKEEINSLITSGTKEHQELMEWSKQMELISQTIETKTHRWLQLAELAE